MFYWFFPPRNFSANAPLVLWLQGGPGASGIQEGLLRVNGPYRIANGTLEEAAVSWNDNFATVYVDQPIGTGFSYANAEYASNMDQVAAMLIDFFDAFYAAGIWPRANDLFLAGESYAGHYVPVTGTAILAANSKRPAAMNIPLQGVAIGDGLTDPQTQVVTKPASAFYFGLVDESTRDAAQAEAEAAAAACASGDFISAKAHRDAMEGLVLTASRVNAYDVRTFHKYDFGAEAQWLNASETRAALGVPAGVFFGTPDAVADALEGDVMRSYKSHIMPLLNLTRGVLLYQGQFDWKDGAVSNAAWVATLGIPGYAESARVVLERGGEPYGWLKNPAGPLFDAVLSSSGHLAPMDQPEAACDLISRFIRGQLAA
ncbi:Alpha/Beta hydrolase protein [Pelagophyceae sp. CCMP2097]|nr:Alpha/Beta hydrolase protein [Pelagophyceae sp. CCMP2097]